LIPGINWSLEFLAKEVAVGFTGSHLAIPESMAGAGHDGQCGEPMNGFQMFPRGVPGGKVETHHKWRLYVVSS